ncbi:RhuM family protein [Holdemanella porci]|uniref:RhuM family protein n=1 Tax=Holdemanella porci TaxID=2652276 RepID=UPI003AF1B48B
MNNEIIKFVNGDLQLDVTVSPDNETVWLNRNQLAQLFDRDVKTIGKHINNALKEELDDSTIAKFATVQTEGNRKIQRSIEYYNLDMIISVGYRVKSQNGVIFRKWATSILKDYMMKGYAINEKRIEVLNKTVSIQSRMLASTLGIEEKEVLNVIEAYSNALSLLDDYDHGCISKPKGKGSIYQLTYEECRTLIDSMKYGGFSDVFGVEKEPGKLNGIIAAVYQNVFGQEIYPSIEEKAANLLYFLVKDHPFVDGCKRIGASIFLEFLNKNQHLIIDGKQIISDSALVAITLMIAESRPEEKETMVKLVMNFLKA